MLDSMSAREINDLEKRLLETEIKKHDREIDSLQRQRKKIRKQMKNPLVSLLVVLLITALLCSSCTLHAGELLGRWEADGVIGLWTGKLEGFQESARSLGTAPYVIASVVLALINLPVGLCGMFLAPLRMIEMALDMTIPAAVTVLAFVEIALVLAVFMVVMKVNEPFTDNRSVRAELRDIDSQLQQHRHERQELCEILKHVKEMEAALDAEVGRLTHEEVDRRSEQMLDAYLISEIANYVPKGIDPTVLRRFYEQDPKKAYASAALVRDVLEDQPEQDSEGMAMTEEQYLTAFDTVFQRLSDEDVAVTLGSSCKRESMRVEVCSVVCISIPHKLSTCAFII